MPLTQDEAEQLYWQADGKDDDCDYQGCLNDATTCLQAFTELGNKEWQGDCLSLIGLTHKKLGNYKEALKYHQKHLDIALQLGDKGGEGRAYGNIGNAHYSLGNYREALIYHQKRLDGYDGRERR